MFDVARPASAIATSGSPWTTLAYQSEWKPSASACCACSTIFSGVAAPPVSPMRMSPPLRRLGVDLQRACIRQIALVPRRLDEAFERPRLEHRAVAAHCPLDRAAPRADLPHAVATLE